MWKKLNLSSVRPCDTCHVTVLVEALRCLSRLSSHGFKSLGETMKLITRKAVDVDASINNNCEGISELRGNKWIARE